MRTREANSETAVRLCQQLDADVVALVAGVIDIGRGRDVVGHQACGDRVRLRRERVVVEHLDVQSRRGGRRRRRMMGRR